MEKESQYQGGKKELLKLSLPLVLTWLSTTMMMFVDRLFLANYSLAALGAAVNAGTIAWGLAYALQFFCEMSQVVVAQYRGSKQYDKQHYPIWQMLFVVLFSFLFYIPLAFFGGKLFFQDASLQNVYFKHIMIFGPAFGLVGATSAYFIGRGEGRIVTYLSIVGNVINLTLDYLMIFGIEGVLQPMGVKGAAVATGIGLSVQGLGLLALFLKRSKASPIFFRKKEFKPCFRAGFAPAIFMGAELLGWGLFFTIMEKRGPDHLAITSICHSITPLLATLGIAMQKAVATVSGELIGSNRMNVISRLMKSATTILFVYIAVISTLMAIFPSAVLKLFTGLSGSGPIDAHFFKTLELALLLACGYLLFGGMRSLFTGVLSAAGDSLFLMLAGGASVWLFLLAPSYYFVYLKQGSLILPQMILCFYGVIVAGIYFTRFWFGRWRDKALLIEKS